MDAFVITGIWTGYKPEQRQIRHVEITTDAKLAEFCRDIGRIAFTDGTHLELKVANLRSGAQQVTERLEYRELIHSCFRANVNSVQQLQAIKKASVSDDTGNARSVLNPDQPSRV